MANPSSRQGLIDYCLRDLGHPVIEINVDDDQIEDRVDEALQFFREYHFDAVELVYLKELIVPSTLNLAANNIHGLNFTVGETITGQTSGATCTVHSLASNTTVNVKNVSGTFVGTDIVIGSVSGTSAGLSTSNPITLGNYDNKYFTTSDAIYGVSRVLPFSSRTRGIDMFDVRYQLLLNDLYSLQSTDLIYYNQVKTQLQLITDLLVGTKPVRFNRHMNRLYVDMDWQNDVDIGEFVIIEAYRILYPNTFTDVYNDMFLKKYTTALIKRQWGLNLKKFEGVQLPGGVTLNGQKIYDEAIEEIQKIESEIQSRFELPVDFFTG